MNKVETPVHVRVTRRFSASAERVFDAWLDPDKVMQWMAAPHAHGISGQMVRAEVDLRVGGLFSFVDLRDGEEVEHAGEYLEIDRPRRLVFTWSVPKESPDWDRVTVEIEPLETGCELTLTCELHPSWTEYAPQVEKGWTMLVEAIAEALGESVA
ncbi:MAG TPA: SRPBCC family protein [Thermoanaerobaculia bacterium]|nr:SRPBCC family protein [Thermoanaerobaculia bacterium]